MSLLCHCLGPTTMMSEGTKNIVSAMKARGIKKLIGCMSGTEEYTFDELKYTVIILRHCVYGLCKKSLLFMLKIFIYLLNRYIFYSNR